MTMHVNTLQNEKCGGNKGMREDLQGLRVFRVQEVPVTDFWAALAVGCTRAGQEAALGGVGDRH